MNKSERIYKVLMIAMIVATIGMLLAMGIIAVKNSMRVKMSIPANPNFLIEVYIQKDGENTSNLVFKNFDDVKIQNGISGLNANTLIAGDDFVTRYGGDFTIFIKNYTTTMGISVSMTSTATLESGSAGVPAEITAVTNTAAKYSGSGVAAEVEFKIANKAVFPQQTLLEITFAELPQYRITYKDQGNATLTGTQTAGSPTTHTYGIVTPLKHAYKTGAIFAGWYTTSDCSGDPVETLGANEYSSDITLYAKWENETKEINGLTFEMYNSGKVLKTDTDNETYYMFKTMAGTYSSVDVEWIVLGGSLEEDYKGGSEVRIDEYTYIPNETLFLSSTYGDDWYATTTKFYIKDEDENEWKEAKTILLLSRYTLGSASFNASTKTGQYSKGGKNDLQGKMANMAETLDLAKTNPEMVIKPTKIAKTSWGGGSEELNLEFFPLGADTAYDENTPIDSFNISKYFGSLTAGADTARIAYSITSKISSSSWWLRSGVYNGTQGGAYGVDVDGRVDDFGADNMSRVVRPCFVFNLA